MDLSQPAQVTADKGFGKRLLDSLVRMTSLFKARRQRLLSIRKLMELDDHLLKDIGFRRDEVLKALREGGMPERIDWVSEMRGKTVHGKERAGLMESRTAGRCRCL